MVKTRTIAAIWALVAGMPGLGYGQDRGAELDAYVTATQERWGFNGVVVVEYQGEELLAKGYGLADTLFGDPVTLQTKFFIGSITKQFTAAAVLLLCQEGSLKLSDPIGKYLPDYPSEPGRKITIHNLLSHSSGLPNYTSFPEMSLRRGTAIKPEDIIASFSTRPLDFEPGTGFKYSNSGYVLLGAIIESVSGQSYEAFLHREIFKPLGMLNTGYGRREMAVPQRAEGYTIDPSGRMIGAAPVSFSMLHSAGALYSTAEDLRTWLRTLDSGSLLSRRSLRLTFTPGTGNYGYGWWLEKRYGRSHAFQDGFLDGYSCILDRWIDDDLTTIVLSNEDEAPVMKIANGIAGILFDQYAVEPILKEAIMLRPERLQECVGVYRTHDGRDRLVVLKNDSLFSYQRGHPPYSLLPEQTDNFFFQKDHTETMSFERDAEGRVIAMIYFDGESGLQYDKIADEVTSWLAFDSPEPRPELLDRLVGEYVLDSAFTDDLYAITVSVSICDKQLCVTISGDAPVQLHQKDDSTFVHPSADFEITFLSDSAETVLGCAVRMGEVLVNGSRSPLLEKD